MKSSDIIEILTANPDALVNIQTGHRKPWLDVLSLGRGTDEQEQQRVLLRTYDFEAAEQDSKPVGDDDLAAFMRDPDVVWYGPHQCNGCGCGVVKSSLETGGVTLNADAHEHNYPNFGWVRHKCPTHNPGFSGINADFRDPAQ